MDKWFAIIKRLRGTSVKDALERESEGEIVSVTEVVPETKQLTDAIGVDSIGFYQQEELEEDS
jgi:hypothetical protein